MAFGTNRTLGSMLADRAREEESVATAKRNITSINQDIAILANPLVNAALKRAEKTDGTVKFAKDDEIFKGEVSKTVKWDQAILMEVLNSIPWDHGKEIFKIELSVGEKVFKAITDEDLKKRIAAARIVTYGEPKISEAT